MLGAPTATGQRLASAAMGYERGEDAKQQLQHKAGEERPECWPPPDRGLL
eukprot:CAMPEP_0115859168 /NCGR_PEP_ID=MMETSP0287-20121206/16476_1 /TAXON_ID=412157 /ORGANISM="Chrysochromulina rotalis, Strain UIO044" /LENGTH=49 /DNA_ID= /DNA_START= /DNA_END= /DNA_ORIENTATION=